MVDRALVLGGGGVTGVAWELGMLAGLAEHGVDLSGADLVVGTSAGALVGAQLTSGVPVEELYESQLTGYGDEVAGRFGGWLIARSMWAVAGRPARTGRMRLGRLALAAPPEHEALWRTAIGTRLPVHTWPDRRLLITAVDAETGEFVAFDSDSGASLVDAVAASCAVPGVWPPVTFQGRRWMDGGTRSPANADLAAGSDRVVILAPIPRGFTRRSGVAAQAAELAGHGSVVTIAPDRDARRVIGRSLLDPARRAPAARAGRAQAATVAADVERVWSDGR